MSLLVSTLISDQKNLQKLDTNCHKYREQLYNCIILTSMISRNTKIHIMISSQTEEKIAAYIFMKM